MDIQEIKETPIWVLYEKGRNFLRLKGVYTDTDRNYNMYNGDQWAGAKLGGLDPIQLNFIKPIVKYKLSVIHANLFAIHYSSQNYESREFRPVAKLCCEMLNRYAANVWEQDKMDYKGRRVTKDAAVNDEGIIYVDFDRETMRPVNEIIKKVDIYYGNENDDDIQNQPYILIRKRLPVVNAIELALSLGMSEDKKAYIIGDNDTFEESGEEAKEELDDMVTLVYKLYKHRGTVHFSVSSRYVEIVGDVDLGIPLYPVAHMTWEEKEGSARGEGEVRCHVYNQLEVNRTIMRRAAVVKEQSFPKRIANKRKVQNRQAMNTVGGTIWTDDATVDDVRKVVGTLPPAQMSPDVKELQSDLIQITRDLAGAGDIASGQVNPESASGRAILAVQQASQAPMTEQLNSYKNFVEDLAKIWLEYLIAYSEDGVQLEQEIQDPATGEDVVQLVPVPQSVLQQLKASVKIDVTPKSPYDKFAQEMTLENLLTGGLLTAQRVGELETYAKILPDDAVAPKVLILEAVERIKAEQRRIAQLQSQAQMMQARASQFLMGDLDTQAAVVADTRAQLAEQQGMGQMAEVPSE